MYSTHVRTYVCMTNCWSIYLNAALFSQAQYIFVYDAVRELLLLGDTTIKANELRKIIAQLKSKSGGKGTGYQQQFAVSGQPLDYLVCVCVCVSL